MHPVTWTSQNLLYVFTIHWRPWGCTTVYHKLCQCFGPNLILKSQFWKWSHRCLLTQFLDAFLRAYPGMDTWTRTGSNWKWSWGFAFFLYAGNSDVKCWSKASNTSFFSRGFASIPACLLLVGVNESPVSLPAASYNSQCARVCFHVLLSMKLFHAQELWHFFCSTSSDMADCKNAGETGGGLQVVVLRL